MSSQFLTGPNYQILGFGSAAGGALGTTDGSGRRRILTTPVPYRSSSLPDPLVRIQSVAAGNALSSCITADGGLYCWGRTGKSTEEPEATRVALKGDRSGNNTGGGIRSVQHGSANQVVALTGEGRAHVWNYNQSSRRPIPREIPSPSLEEEEGTIESEGAVRGYSAIGCSEQCALLLRMDGRALYEYRFTNSSSRVPHHPSPSSMHRQQLRAIHFGSQICITNIGCGPHHSAAISDTGVLFTFGFGQYGRLGLGDEEQREDPTPVASLTEQNVVVAAVSCGAAHTCAVTRDGTVWAFGWNAYGQVWGHVDTQFLEPCEIFIGEKVTSVSCGFGHTAAVTTEGKLYTWGFNGEGQLGIGHEENVDSPTLVRGFQTESEGDDSSSDRYVLSVSCGNLHTICLTSNLPPSQIEVYERQKKLEAKCKEILYRFARYALLRIRLRESHQKSTHQPLPPSHLNNSSQAAESDSSSDSSSCSSSGFMSDAEKAANESAMNKENSILLGDEAIRQYQEMASMQRESERSRRQALAQALREKTEREAGEESRRQKDFQRERDAIENDRLRKKAAKDRDERNKMRQKIAKRNSRMEASIEREANRLRQARELRNQKATAKVVLPKINRRRILGVSAMSRQARTGSNDVSKTKAVPHSRRVTAAHNEQRDDLLLKRRAERLKEQQQNAKEEQMRQEQEKARTQKLMSERRRHLERERERLEKERRHRVECSLRDLKKKLGIFDRSQSEALAGEKEITAEKERFQFKSSKEWAAHVS